MNEIKLTIPGEPNALKRHRTVKVKSGININYDPSHEDKSIFAWKAIADNKPDKPYSGPTRLTVYFYMPRPKSHFRTGKFKGLVKDAAPVFHIVKPDLDNLIKFVKDALNKIYWTDDSIICTIISRKLYSENPRTEITIKKDY